VVVDFVSLRQLTAATEQDAHRAAVMCGVAEASRWRDVPVPVLGPEWGRRIDLDTFYGPLFDQRKRRLLLPAGYGVSTELQQRGFPGRSRAKFYGPYTWTDSDDVEHALWFGEGETPAAVTPRTSPHRRSGSTSTIPTHPRSEARPLRSQLVMGVYSNTHYRTRRPAAVARLPVVAVAPHRGIDLPAADAGEVLPDVSAEYHGPDRSGPRDEPTPLPSSRPG
jgi:hypothetical protein